MNGAELGSATLERLKNSLGKWAAGVERRVLRTTSPQTENAPLCRVGQLDHCESSLSHERVLFVVGMPLRKRNDGPPECTFHSIETAFWWAVARFVAKPTTSR